MIVREHDEGIIIIRQADHAALSGEIAKAWHPPGKPRERPIDALLIAASEHDAGWKAWEDNASQPLDEAGRPRDFMHMRLDEHLAVWQDSINICAGYNLYAGVLSSMHAVSLYEGRLASMPDPEEERAKMRVFIAEQITWQESMLELLVGRAYYAEHLSEQALTANLRLLQVWDTLSLMLCMPWLGERTWEGVPLGDGVPGTLRAEATPEGVLRLAPYLLHHESFPLMVIGRMLPKASFAHQGELAQAYSDAPPVSLQFQIRPA